MPLGNVSRLLIPPFVHELKCVSPHFENLSRGKRIEVRSTADRTFAVGDHLKLRHYIPAPKDENGQPVPVRDAEGKLVLDANEQPTMVQARYSGSIADLMRITHVLTHEQFPDGIKPGYAALSLEPVDDRVPEIARPTDTYLSARKLPLPPADVQALEMRLSSKHDHVVRLTTQLIECQVTGIEKIMGAREEVSLGYLQQRYAAASADLFLHQEYLRMHHEAAAGRVVAWPDGWQQAIERSARSDG